MLLTSLKNDINAAKRIRLPWWILLPGVIVAAFSAALFDRFGKLYLVLPVLNSIAVLGFLVALKWKLRKRIWFWVTIIIVAALHVPLILFIPWTTKWVPALAIAAIDSADFCVILAILSVVEKFMGEPQASEG
ncbi:MAG: hypothetical protein KGK08_13510 [Acidobacteriota bacterium]|nr:hypothetical protein [Acidobacteriota bacterium]